MSSICLSVCLSKCLPFYLFIYLSICQSFCLFFCFSVCLSIYISIVLSVFAICPRDSLPLARDHLINVNLSENIRRFRGEFPEINPSGRDRRLRLNGAARPV